MMRACSRCGRIHAANYKCNVNRVYQGGIERDLRHSNEWTKKSLEIREKAHYLCEVCRDQGKLVYEGTEVHHISKVKNQPTLLLDNSNLICLCLIHHRQADRGEIDADYLRSLARHREGQ